MTRTKPCHPNSRIKIAVDRHVRRLLARLSLFHWLVDYQKSGWAEYLPAAREGWSMEKCVNLEF